MRIDRVKFAAALARADLNVKRLAEKSGASRVTVSSVKNGKTCSKNTTEKLAAILGRDIIQQKNYPPYGAKRDGVRLKFQVVQLTFHFLLLQLKSKSLNCNDLKK